MRSKKRKNRGRTVTDKSYQHTFSKEEVLNIAIEQKRLCSICFGVIIIIILAIVAPFIFLFLDLHEDAVLLETVAMLAPIIQSFLIIWLCVVVYYLARALKRNAWLYVLGLFIPIISIILILVLVRNASKVLKVNNIAVGVMGAKKRSLENYIKAYPEEAYKKGRG